MKPRYTTTKLDEKKAKEIKKKDISRAASESKLPPIRPVILKSEKSVNKISVENIHSKMVDESINTFI